jgi:hypothetical protein
MNFDPNLRSLRELKWVQVMVAVEEALSEPGDRSKPSSGQPALRAHRIGDNEIEIAEWAQGGIRIALGDCHPFERDDLLIQNRGDGLQHLGGPPHLHDRDQLLQSELIRDRTPLLAPDPRGDEMQAMRTQSGERSAPAHQAENGGPDIPVRGG